MKIALIILFTLFSSCTHKKSQRDIIDKLILLHKTDNIKDLKFMFGEPDDIKKDPRVPSEITWFYSKFRFESGINPKTNKIVGSVLYFWKDFDNYAYLKKRFKNYKWIEEELPPLQTHYANDPRKVQIPDLGITFYYDDQDPQRRVMEIYFH